MIHESLISLDLPTQLGPPLPTNTLAAIENLLFVGHWSQRRASCPLSAAVVLARCHRVLSALGCRDFTVLDDAGCVLAQGIPAALGSAPEPRWPETLPPAWLEQPCELLIRASLTEGGVVAALTLRYTPRHDPEQGALTGAVRTLWDVRPREGAERSFRGSFEAALKDERSLRELARRMRDRGQQLTQDCVRGLEEAFEAGPGHSHGSLLALHGYREHPERFGELLAGLPEPPRLALALLEERLARSDARWPALDAHGVPGRLHRGRFVPTAEVAHVA